MSHVRVPVYLVLIVALVALAGFGVIQVIGGQEDANPSLTPQEAQRRSDVFRAKSFDAVLSFADSEGDPCSLPHNRSLAALIGPSHEDLPALVNDSDIVVTGRPVASITEKPSPASGAGRMLTTFEIDASLTGAASAGVIIIDSGQVVALNGDDLGRSSILVPDFCTLEPVLLFLERTASVDTYGIIGFGFDRIAGDGLDLATISPAFQGYDSEQAVMDAVVLIASEQRAQGIPKGLLVCQSKRASGAYHPPITCPGESFNPYRGLQFGLLAGGIVATFEPGGGRAVLATLDLIPADSQTTQLLATLDVEVTMEAGEPLPEDVVKMRVIVAPPSGRRSYTLWYSPGSGFIQSASSGSQFPAPGAFQKAMVQFLATP